MIKELIKWEVLTEDIVEVFLREYFELLDEEDPYFYWIGDEVGGVFEFADYFIDFQTILDCYKLGVSKEQFFLWYNSSLEQLMDLSLSDFILSPKKLKEQQEKHLQESKERLIFAQEEFNKALKENNLI